ncbi:unnamed protein product, partial [Laminaria digitata]
QPASKQQALGAPKPATPRSDHRKAVIDMSGIESDEFNFVGLVRSPVKRTPETGYYAGEGRRTNTRGEPVSAATTERMSVESSTTSTDPRRRRALHQVPANTLDTSKASRTPSSLALLSSSISRKKSSARAALSARRSETLPVPRTLSLSPAEAPRPADPAMASDRADCARDRSGSNSKPHYPRDFGRHSPPPSTRAPLFHEKSSHTPSPEQQQQQQHQQQQHQQQQESWSSNPSHGGRPGTRTPTTVAPYASSSHHASYTGGSAARHTPLQTPASTADPYHGYPSSHGAAVEEERSYAHHNDDGEWSDCSFTGAVFSPDPSSLAPVHCSSGSGDTSGVGRSGGISSSSRGCASTAGSALRGVGVGGATPRCAAGLQASPFPEGTMNLFGASTTTTTTTPVVEASLALMRVGGSSVAPESASSSASRNAALRVRATPAAAEREGDELPDTTAAEAATLAAMM